jgi:hypothetical protein
MLLVVIVMFYNVLWGFFIDPPYFGYNYQENSVLRIFKFQEPSRTQIDLGFWSVNILSQEAPGEEKSTRRGLGVERVRWRGPPARPRHPYSLGPRASVAVHLRLQTLSLT